MGDGPAGEEVPRIPTTDDLVRIARSLNAHGALYAVIGGFAMEHYGFARPTSDIDLLIDASEENVALVCKALTVLPDRASLEVEPGDVAAYTVVRVADEVVVDLLGSAAGVTWSDVAAHLVTDEVDGVAVRYLDIEALLRTKQTIRPKDAMDRAYLERVLAGMK